MDGPWAGLVGGGQRRRDSWEWDRGGGGGGKVYGAGGKELAVRETVRYARDIGEWGGGLVGEGVGREVGVSMVMMGGGRWMAMWDSCGNGDVVGS